MRLDWKKNSKKLLTLIAEISSRADLSILSS